MFTPGPWEISRHHQKINGGWPAHYMIGQQDEMYDHAIVLSSEDSGEGKANANLIAAAPDMYEALKYIVEQYGHCMPLNKAKAALAKAEGRKP